MRVLFLNQYFPPDPAPTGVLFRELADALVERGHEVDFVAAEQDYRAGQQKGGRMKRELMALRRMVAAGKARPRADVVISGTSPPCLAVFADRVAAKHRARHFHWAMDVYPEIAVALGEIKRGSLVARFTSWLMGRAYRRCAKVVALDADMVEVLARHGVEPVCIRPWVFQSVLAQLAAPAPVKQEGKPWTWIYSGNLGRAHEWETLLRAQQLLEQRSGPVRLVFQGGGPSWQKAQDRARELQLTRCEWRGYAPETELRDALLAEDALVVTQRPETRGLLWPSKLGLVTALPRPVLFVGPTDGAIARELRGFAHAGIFGCGDVEGVAAWVQARQSGDAPAIAAVADPGSQRTAAVQAWVDLIRG